MLLRNPAQQSYFEHKNIKPILFSGVEDIAVIKQAASENDIVVNGAISFAADAARALIHGLAERKRLHPDKRVFMLHTSGTSNLGDRPVSKRFVEPRYAEGRVFLDTEDIDGYHRMREKLESYPQRTTDVAVVDTGIAENVPTYILMPPTVWGKGTGHFNKRSVQLPGLCKAAVHAKQAAMIGDGSGVIDHVHVVDLAQLYEKMFATLAAGEKLPSGREGIYFCETGHHTWRELSEGIAKEGKEMGVLQTDEVRSVGLEESAKVFVGGLIKPEWVELALAMNGRTKTTKARQLWEPQYTKEDFLKSVRDELEVVRGEHD